jgi:hypothetical protein
MLRITSREAERSGVKIIYKTIEIVILCPIGGTFVWMAWNNTMPQLFNLPIITWWQGFWLMVLTGEIFGHIHINYKD